MTRSFHDRIAAGRQLARTLREYRRSDTTVIGLARGGVVVGYGLAQELELRLEALVVRKVGSPDNPELALGAVSETGVHWIDRDLVALTATTNQYLAGEIERQTREADRRRAQYGAPNLGLRVRNRRAILVDDGIATGASALVGILSLRDLGASPILLATPVAAQQAVDLLTPYAERIVVLCTPEPFISVSAHYQDFAQVKDEEVVALLRN